MIAQRFLHLPGNHRFFDRQCWIDIDGHVAVDTMPEPPSAHIVHSHYAIDVCRACSI